MTDTPEVNPKDESETKDLDSLDILEAPQPQEWTEIENPRQRALLTAYQETGNVSASCRFARVARATHYLWIEEDQKYAAAVASCQQGAVDRLEQEAYRRATEGVKEPTGWYKGQAGGYVQKYSDNLAMFLLKGLRPETYADKIELKGALANLDLTQLPDHLLNRIAQGEHPLVVLASAQEDPARLVAGEVEPEPDEDEED